MKYCIWFSTPKYDNRDAIVGSRHAKGRCFTKLRAAKKAYKREAANSHDELHVDLCAGDNNYPCTQGWQRNSKKGPISLRKRSTRRPSTAKQCRTRRRANDRDLPF